MPHLSVVRLPDDLLRLCRRIGEAAVAAHTELRAAASEVGLERSLTTLLSGQLEEQAVAIWKSILLYTSVQIESAAYVLNYFNRSITEVHHSGSVVHINY